MGRREFQFSEGSSNKFWAIEVDGTSQKVHFGRVGTAGQAQVKTFDTEDAAKKASEKLIAEKVKKGYAEVTAGTKSAGTPTPTVKKAEGEPAEKKPKAKSEPEPVAVPPAVATVSERSIDLEPEEFLAFDRTKREPLAKPAAAPFNLEECLAKVRKVPVAGWGWNWNWPRAGMPVAMDRDEAQFWFAAMTTLEHNQVVSANSTERSKELPKKLADQLAKFKPKATFTFDDAKAGVQRTPNMLKPIVVLPLSNLFAPDELLEFSRQKFNAGKGIQYGGDWNEGIRSVLVDGYCQYVAPYLAAKDLAALEASIRPALDPKDWPTDFYARPPMEFFLAALLGLSKELRAVLGTLPDDRYTQGGWDHSHYHQTQRIVFGLMDAKEIESEMRRLKLPLRSPDLLRKWLAATRYAALDYVRDNILAETKKDECEALLEVFALVKAPEAAPHMLELKLASKAPGVARQWLDDNVGHAVAGLIPTAAGRGKLAGAAIEYLREAKKKGHETLIRDCLKDAAPEVAESIQKGVLDYAEKEYATLDLKAMPAELKAAFEVKGKKGKLPAWAAVTGLPPILVADRKLGDDPAAAVLDALQRSAPGKADPLVAALKTVADADSLDAFAWKLFQLWQGEGSPSKEKWAMAAVGLFGGDASALKLTPLVRNWPGESQHQRAVFGLECLRAIGSDTALMQLNGIAQKLKFKGLKQKATEAMEAIATDKGLTRSQLEDRIVPDCDLDERGGRTFDFGPRQFRFVLGPDMKPMVKDADGKVKTDLPKPGAKDDAALAEAAVNDWKLMKKQVKEVATIQAQRLEQAMVTGRRWPVADFATLLVKHPLMTNLVRLILWGAYDAAGQLKATFRVTEDQTFADIKDGEFSLKEFAEVGIVHPLRLSAAEQSAWGEVFSDYELVPPFRQLGRRVVRPEPSELTANEIVRFKGIAVPAPTMVYGLEKLGWVRGAGMDGGGFDEHSKPFPNSGVTAVVHYEGTVGFGYIDPNEMLKFENCYFVKGIRGPSGYENKEKTVALKDVDPVVISEVLTDLSALAAKGK